MLIFVIISKITYNYIVKTNGVPLHNTFETPCQTYSPTLPPRV
ncbi:hypothetical protein DHD32_08230 [Arenibacter sp. TNZ]|nr:hypothetical protein [Arenibacter sp. TNZ]